MTVQFGQHPTPSHVLAHLSDTHLLAGGDRLHGLVDTEAELRAVLDRLSGWDGALDAIVITGDVADRGEEDAYRRVRDAVDPVAAGHGADVVWVMGNHDLPGPFRRTLLGSDADGPVTTVTDVRGLRVIALDSSVRGYHHGAIGRDQLDWLADELSRPAEHGSILALHHPPIPTPLALMQLLELEDEEGLADVVRGSDVRMVLAGHLHHPTTSLFAGVPVAVAGASAYTMDLAAPRRELVGIDGGRSFGLVHVYPDRITHSVVPVSSGAVVTHFDAAFLDRVEALPDGERRDAFSRWPDA